MAAKPSSKQVRAERDRLRSYQARAHNYELKRARRARNNKIWGFVIAGTLVVGLGASVAFSLIPAPKPATSAAPSAASSQVPSSQIAKNKDWYATLGINGQLLNVTLAGSKAPQAVSSTIFLAQRSFYKGLSCHRLTTSGIFVLQCGDPKGDGTGGPGYSYGPIENAPANNVYPAGTIAMARQGGNAGSQGSQFFIVYKDSMIPSDAAGGYTVIGQVTTGLDKLITNIVSQGVQGGSQDGAPTVKTTIDYFSILP